MKNILGPDEINNINYICDDYGIVGYTINNDGSIDVKGNVRIEDNTFSKLPLTFNRVGGKFECHNNLLNTLKGAPKFVGGEFNCQGNRLKNLEHCPEIVMGDFVCSNNLLTSMEGAPKKIYRYFSCTNNQISTLDHFPIISSENGFFHPNFGANKFPEIVMDELLEINWMEPDEINIPKTDKYNIFLKYQNHFDVWENGFNEENFKELMAEINDGLL